MESKSDSSKAPGKTIQFYPFSTIIDSSFWIELRRLKLDQLKLDSSPVVISPVFSTSRANSHLVQLNYESFQEQQRSPRNLDCAEHYLRGKLIVFNTKSDFDQVDKRALIGSTGLEIWNALCDQTVDRNLDHHLCPFLMIVFGDLKSYCFHYWCAYPALAFPPNILNIAHKPFAEHFSQSQLQSITNQLSSNRNLFFPIIENQSVKLTSFDCFWSLENIESITESQVLFAFEDPSPSGEYPGWPLRNYICYVHKRLEQLKRKYSQNSSVQKFVNKLEECALFASIRSHTVNKSVDKCSIYQLRIWNKENVSLPPVVGWERNKTANNQLVANYVDCSSILNPEVLCRDALHLNLKLMKWRLAPSLDLELIRDTRCLLLGAGTLGCNVARSLVAWGINRITFVDNRNVSYSNPSRQTLYTFRDAIGGNKSKAKTAAEALKLIQPTIESEGFDLNIKMPGHCSNDVESDRKDVELLERLVDEHDVLFLLTDTRESRWLPTVIAASKHKIVLNVALGFDTFLVQRHGMRLRTGNSLDQQSPLYSLFEAQLKLKQKLSSSNPTMPFYLGSELGCYYCNDVFAPGNSMKDRTLDQQCTVTRPGISMAASGYAVELLISILQHPAKALAPALYTTITDDTISQLMASLDLQESQVDLLQFESLLGMVPHQFRGYLSRFESITPTFTFFEQCVACSATIIDKYREDGLEFILSTMNNSKVLEELTGLQMYHNVDDVDTLSLSDEEEEDDSRGDH